MGACSNGPPGPQQPRLFCFHYKLLSGSASTVATSSTDKYESLLGPASALEIGVACTRRMIITGAVWVTQSAVERRASSIWEQGRGLCGVLFIRGRIGCARALQFDLHYQLSLEASKARCWGFFLALGESFLPLWIASRFSLVALEVGRDEDHCDTVGFPNWGLRTSHQGVHCVPPPASVCVSLVRGRRLGTICPGIQFLINSQPPLHFPQFPSALKDLPLSLSTSLSPAINLLPFIVV